MKAKQAAESIVYSGKMWMSLALIFVILSGSVQLPDSATQIDIFGPAGSGRFGSTVTVLPNGNLVIIDPGYSAGGNASIGAVYLYNGATGAQISMLVGSAANDRVGSGGISVLTNGNYVICSSDWSNFAGATTWGSATSGVSGLVSASNSLVISWFNSSPGCGVKALSNGNYVVSSPAWNYRRGAVTWGSGTSGVQGLISSANSLVGSTVGDEVGQDVKALSNGSYVVLSPSWYNGLEANVGAVTWGSGTSGMHGGISSANSLVGSLNYDHVGSGGITVLTNGNYVVSSPFWSLSTGAATWGSATSGVSVVVSAANSLVGSGEDDPTGYGVTALSNGNYVVSSPSWNSHAGAATWGSGTSGVHGTITSAISLVGSTAGDKVGQNVTALSNGSYVVGSPSWSNNIGAATWGSGMSGVHGPISAANSLVGSTAGDKVGPTVTALSNGNYVVISPNWSNNAGAATWGSGMSGVHGEITSANSLVGSTDDWVGLVFPLSNGNYVVGSPDWSNGTGAATWGSGTSGVHGTISSANSLVGSTASDYVGFHVIVLSNGNYVVGSPTWTSYTGAATWGNGSSGVSGVVSSSNSLVGSTLNDQVGASIIMLHNGNYLVSSPQWSSGAGAVTWGSGTSGISGVVSSANSLVGSSDNDGVGSVISALTNGNYVVGSPLWNRHLFGVIWLTDAGAATWGSGTSGVQGTVGLANSLVGGMGNDQVGFSVTGLSSGNYVVGSPRWSDAGNTNAGAATWGSGMKGAQGIISSANSLVGSTANDGVGSNVSMLSNGDYVVLSPAWDFIPIVDAGAASYGFGQMGLFGEISVKNSVRGTFASGGAQMFYVFDSTNHQLVVSWPAENIVTLFRPSIDFFLPLVTKN